MHGFRWVNGGRHKGSRGISIEAVSSDSANGRWRNSPRGSFPPASFVSTFQGLSAAMRPNSAHGFLQHLRNLLKRVGAYDDGRGIAIKSRDSSYRATLNRREPPHGSVSRFFAPQIVRPSTTWPAEYLGSGFMSLVVFHEV